MSRKVGEVQIPKVGWVRFRWSRTPFGFKSYRVTLDRSGRWHVALAIIPPAIPAPGNGVTVGVDRGIVVSAALSTGELLSVRGLSDREAHRLVQLQRKFARSQRTWAFREDGSKYRVDSKRRAALRLAIAKLKAREVDRRKDWVEKLSTQLAREFDVIGIEDLKVKQMSKSAKGSVEKPGRNVRQKAGLNRGILANGWALLANRLDQKAPGRVVRVPAAYTSQRCSACGFVSEGNRESQAVFVCKASGFACNADVNAAKNIERAAGLVVAAQTLSVGAQAQLVCEPPTRKAA